MSKILCRNCQSELPSAQEMLTALRGAHAVLYLLEQEIGHLGFGASRVAERVKRIVASYDESAQSGRADVYCICSGGLTSMDCPIHRDGVEVKP